MQQQGTRPAYAYLPGLSAPPFRSFPVAIPGTAFARGMKARAELMRRIHASLDLLDARKAQQPQQARQAQQEGEQGQNGTAKPAGQDNGSSEGMAAASDLAGNGEQRTALDLLYSSRDEDGKGMCR